MTKAQLINELVVLGFQAETLEGKTNAQLQAMLNEAQTEEEPVVASEPEVVKTPVNTNSKAVMVRNVNHDGKEYKTGQVLTDSDPVRLFLRQGYAQ